MIDTAEISHFRHPALIRFGFAIVAVTAVFAIDRLWAHLIDDGSQFLLLGTAVMATAWIAGTGPALAATILGAVFGAYGGDAGGSTAAYMHLALFVVQGLLLTAAMSEVVRARRSAEQQARAADAARQAGETASRMKDEFLTTVSHELRTPLNAVLGWVHLLRSGKLDPATMSRGLETIDRNIRLQAQLTSDLLDVSKALTGQLQVVSQPVLLDDAVRQAVAAAQSAASAKAVQIRCSMPEAAVVVLGDLSRLRQVVWQLLSNAIKFTPRGGDVDVSLERRHDQAQVTVRDSGSGIDPAFLPHVFDRFTQADVSPTRVTGGLGVGLALLRELVELQGGEVEAANRTDAAGSIFCVRFPLHAADPSTVAAHALPSTVREPPLDGLRVLVLDQDREGRELLRTLLQQYGAVVRAVSSVAEALEALEGWEPDVLVSDSFSPEHDFYALVGRVQSLDTDKGGRIPALALTNIARTDHKMMQMLAPVRTQLSKPVEPSLLAFEIARLTGREGRPGER